MESENEERKSVKKAGRFLLNSISSFALALLLVMAGALTLAGE